MSKKTIAEEFQLLRGAIIPQDAHPMQVRDMECSFYAGASASFAMINGAIFKEDANIETIFAELKRIKDELLSFTEKVEDISNENRIIKVERERPSGGKLDS